MPGTSYFFLSSDLLLINIQEQLLRFPDMEKRAISVLIPNCAASGFQVNPSPLGMARSPGRSSGEVATGITHTLQQMPSAGLRTEEMRYPAKQWPTTPEGLQPPRNQSGRRFHSILFRLEWNSRAQWKRNGQQAHSSEHNSQVRMCFPEVTVALRMITAIPWRLRNIM